MAKEKKIWVSDDGENYSTERDALIADAGYWKKKYETGASASDVDALAESDPCWVIEYGKYDIHDVYVYRTSLKIVRDQIPGMPILTQDDLDNECNLSLHDEKSFAIVIQNNRTLTKDELVDSNPF